MTAPRPIPLKIAAGTLTADQLLVARPVIISGLPLKVVAQADTAGAATLATLIADHNTLLANLRTAGILAV